MRGAIVSGVIKGVGNVNKNGTGVCLSHSIHPFLSAKLSLYQPSQKRPKLQLSTKSNEQSRETIPSMSYPPQRVVLPSFRDLLRDIGESSTPSSSPPPPDAQAAFSLASLPQFSASLYDLVSVCGGPGSISERALSPSSPPPPAPRPARLPNPMVHDNQHSSLIYPYPPPFTHLTPTIGPTQSAVLAGPAPTPVATSYWYDYPALRYEWDLMNVAYTHSSAIPLTLSCYSRVSQFAFPNIPPVLIRQVETCRSFACLQNLPTELTKSNRPPSLPPRGASIFHSVSKQER